MSRTGFEISLDLLLRENTLENVKQTRYPHLDKRHLQYYSVDALAFGTYPDTSIYGMLLSSIIHYHQNIAIEYFGRKITYDELLNNIDNYANAFKKMGIEKGEIISLISYNIPEVYYSIYALNKIGAVVSLINPETDIERIKYYLNKVQSKRLIMMDVLEYILKDIIEDTLVKEIYTIKITDSLPFGLNYLENIKINNSKNIKSLKKNVKLSKKNVTKDIYEEMGNQTNRGSEVAIIINTPETTFSPKSIMFTNENLNASAYSYKNSGMDFQVGDVFLGTMPNLSTNDVSMCMHMPLVLGLKNIIIPKINPTELSKYLVKYEPNHLIGLPIYYQYMLDNDLLFAKDLSFIKNIMATNDSLNSYMRMQINKFLLNHQCGKLKVFYTCPETCGFITSQLEIGESSVNNITNVGIPSIYTNIKIEHKKTHKPLHYYEIGEVTLSGKGVMKGYYNDISLTSEVLEKTSEGNYLHTNDIGYVDECGNLYIEGKIKRIITTSDGYKIIPSEIERLFLKHDLVSVCACVGLENSNYFQEPVVFIKIKDGYENESAEIIKELKNMLWEKFSTRDIIKGYVILDNIPMVNNKIDYEYLENNYIYKDVHDIKVRKRKMNL